MASARSKAMASKTEDSMMEKTWTKNICRRQAEAETTWASASARPSRVGIRAVAKPTSDTLSRKRKKYIGQCKVGSRAMIQRIVLLPRTERR